jgi:hypothetical protein
LQLGKAHLDNVNIDKLLSSHLDIRELEGHQLFILLHDLLFLGEKTSINFLFVLIFIDAQLLIEELQLRIINLEATLCDLFDPRSSGTCVVVIGRSRAFSAYIRPMI